MGDEQEVRLHRQGLGYSVKVWTPGNEEPEVIYSRKVTSDLHLRKFTLTAAPKMDPRELESGTTKISPLY